MAISTRGLGNSSPWLSALEPNGALQPSLVHTGVSDKPNKARNQTDEDACPEEGLSPSREWRLNNEQILTPEMLMSLAATDEVSDVLERLVSYIAIVPDLGQSFATIGFLDKSALKIEQREKCLIDAGQHWQFIQDKLFNTSPSLSLGIHAFIQDWLTFGDLYAAIIREKKNGKPIDIHIQTTEFTEKKFNNGETYWSTDYNQYIWEKEDMFSISYADINKYARSYVASILRVYNLFTTTEKTRFANAVMTAQFRSIYTVPTQGLGKTKARQKLSSVMSLYKREVRIDPNTGATTINGENSYPVNTELWVAETSQGAVKIENPGDGNPQLNNMDIVEYFARKYYKRAKLPMSKWEAVDTSYLSGLSQIDEDERQFNLFIQNDRSVIAKFFLDILWRLMQPIKDYTGRNDIRADLTMVWHDEPKHDTPSEAMDTLNDILDKISSTVDKYIDTLKAAGFSGAQQTARANVLRVKLMQKYCPEILEQTEEDYRNVPVEESTSGSDTTSGWDESGDDSWGSESGTDDYSDWGNDDWDSEFGSSSDDSDWSMPEDTTENFDDFSW